MKINLDALNTFTELILLNIIKGGGRGGYKEFMLNSGMMSPYLCHCPRDERSYLACSQDESISAALLA